MGCGEGSQWGEGVWGEIVGTDTFRFKFEHNASNSRLRCALSVITVLTTFQQSSMIGYCFCSIGSRLLGYLGGLSITDRQSEPQSISILTPRPPTAASASVICFSCHSISAASLFSLTSVCWRRLSSRRASRSAFLLLPFETFGRSLL